MAGSGGRLTRTIPDGVNEKTKSRWNTRGGEQPWHDESHESHCRSLRSHLSPRNPLSSRGHRHPRGHSGRFDDEQVSILLKMLRDIPPVTRVPTPTLATGGFLY